MNLISGAKLQPKRLKCVIISSNSLINLCNLALFIKILGGCDAKMLLKGAGEVGCVVVGAEQGDLGNGHLRMVVEQVAGALHTVALDKRLGCLVGDGCQTLAELEQAHVHALCHMVGIHLS